jgi:N-acetylglucosaminyl-diphospho-decaprenol L-rhamnosyltransferase
VKPTSAPPAGSDSPLISISVVSHGDSANLTTLLQTLAHHENPGRIQMLVTDNRGRDLPAFDPAPWYSLTLLRNARPAGYARNHNAAFQHAQADYFCVVNPDVRFVQSVFPVLVESIKAGEGAITAPLVVDSSGIVQDSFRRLPSPLELVQRRLRGTAPARPFPHDLKVIRADWIAGIFMLFHREIFARLNGFDARYRLYFEDVDFCTRARLMGLTSVVNAGVRIQHDARRASRRPGQFLVWHLQSSWRFFTSSAYWRARDAGPHRNATR